MHELRVGVVGLGWFGERHARAYAQLPGARLAAVFDLDPTRTGRVAAATGAEPHADLSGLLSRPDIDAVSICLPDRLHLDAALAAISAGKAILLEKPLAHDTATARQIVEAVEARGTRLMVGHILRFDPRYEPDTPAAAAERLAAPSHSRPTRTGVRATPQRLGGASSILFYMGVHDIDAMQWIGRSPITRVYAQKRQALGTGNEDALYAVVNFANGAVGSLDLSWAWPAGLMNGYRASFEIVGTQSAAYLDCADQGFYAVGEEGTVGGDTHLWPEINGRIVGDLADEISHFVEATRTGQPYHQHHREAFAAIPPLDALKESAERGVPVEVRR